METKGSVLVAGGGIAGVQAALDLADSGFYVHLVEKDAAIGGRMSQLDKTFPTNDCSACILSPKLVECGRHLNINLLTMSQVKSLSGEPGNFKVKVLKRPRYVDPNKCIACGLCAEKCPKKVTNPFNLGLGTRKAIYLSYPQAVPLKYAIDPESCIWLNKPGRCGMCEKVCPAGAINFNDAPQELELEVGAVIAAPGFKPFDPSGLDFTGYGRIPDVVTAMEFERVLSPSGPCMGHMERPSDGSEPRRIAWLQCIGSRDINRACHGYCSSVCCMYAVKQAMIAREHASVPIETEIFFMDMRTHGKGFEEFYNRASREGIGFHRARVHTIIPDPDGQGGVMIRYADSKGEIHRQRFDLAVLSVGLEMGPEAVELFETLGVELDQDGFVNTSVFSPVTTNRPGVFVCGAAAEPKDIPQAVTEASAAALEAQALLAPARWRETKTREFPPERDVFSEPPRIGVFVCHCGINIAGVIDVKRVTQYARTLPGVVFAQDNLFTCSQDTIDKMAHTIKEQGLNRVVVASCSPRTHEALFQETLREAGINRHLFEMANIRDQDSWVHQDQPEAATQKAMDLVRMAVAKVKGDQPLPYNTVPVTKSALVVGGGVAGMTAALSVARQGYPVTLVEKEDELGGNARRLFSTWQGDRVGPWLKGLISKVWDSPLITVKTGTSVERVSGSMGRFITTLSDGSPVEHGVTIMATGGRPLDLAKDRSRLVTESKGYLYGEDPRVLTLLDLDQRLSHESEALKGMEQAVFIHCVGSRVPERPYCSRVCCTHAIDQAIRLKESNPDAKIFMLYRDIRTYGKREHLYHEARRRGIIFVQYDLDHPPTVQKEGGDLVVKALDPVIDAELKMTPDLLILATAVVPGETTASLAQYYKCAVGPSGFLMEAHAKLRPVDFATDGVFLAGLCHYPKPLEESIAQAEAAAARAGVILARDAVPAESVTASVDQAKCTGCGLCLEICPYKAVSLTQEGARVDPGLCKGCGACVAGCRSGAITLLNTGNQQIMAAVEAAMDDLFTD